MMRRNGLGHTGALHATDGRGVSLNPALNPEPQINTLEGKGTYSVHGGQRIPRVELDDADPPAAASLRPDPAHGHALAQPLHQQGGGSFRVGRLAPPTGLVWTLGHKSNGVGT